MFKKITKIFTIFLLAFFVYAPFCLAQESSTKTGLEKTAGTAFGGSIPFENGGIPGIIGQLIGAVLAFVGVFFFVLMIYGGILWMTARGNEEQVTKAKDLITAAIIGLIIVLSAYAITAFVGRALTSTS